MRCFFIIIIIFRTRVQVSSAVAGEQPAVADIERSLVQLEQAKILLEERQIRAELAHLAPQQQLERLQQVQQQHIAEAQRLGAELQSLHPPQAAIDYGAEGDAQKVHWTAYQRYYHDHRLSEYDLLVLILISYRY